MPSIVTLGLRIEWDDKVMGDLEIIPGIYEEEDRILIPQWELLFIWQKTGCHLTLRNGVVFRYSFADGAKVRVIAKSSGKILFNTLGKKIDG